MGPRQILARLYIRGLFCSWTEEAEDGFPSQLFRAVSVKPFIPDREPTTCRPRIISLVDEEGEARRKTNLPEIFL